MLFQIPISEKYPYFAWRAARRPAKALKAWRRREKMPSNIWIEITSRCNLRCRSCSKLYKAANSDADMELSLFDRIVEEVAPGADTINLTGIGESLFHRQAEQIFEKLEKWPKICLLFTTNGILMNEEWIQRLARRRCNVIFSIDGIDQETHQFNRPKGDLSKLQFCLARARELEIASGDLAYFPFSRNINFLVMKNNMRQMPGMILWAKDYNLASIRFILMNDWGCAEAFWKEQNPLNYRDELIALLDESRRLAARYGVPLIAPDVFPRPPSQADEAVSKARRRKSGLWGLFKPTLASELGYSRYEDRYCHVPFDSIYISANGKASVCCAAVHYELGDVNRQTVHEIWNGRPFRLLRAGMAIGAHTSYCRRCDLPFGLAGGNPRSDLSG